MAALLLPMSAPKSLFRRHFRATSSLLGVLVAAILANPAAAQARQDQVLFLDARGQPRTVRGTIQENSLTQVVINDGNRDRDIETALVQRVDFGDVPPSYLEGTAYFDRRDYENAARQFQVAATDAAARPTVQAAARLNTARAWMLHGAADPNAFVQARDETGRFLTDFPENREVPEARALQGRATWLSGDPSAAAEVYRALYQELSNGTPTQGYSLLDCFGGGLAAARASLAAADTDSARSLFEELGGSIATAISSLEPTDPQVANLQRLQSEVRLGEGFVLLAAGSSAQARTFFQRQLGDANGNTAQRYGARLGLAEAMLADGDVRQAMIEFATVSAIDHTDRDRVARALVGLAECALRLPDSDGRQNAKNWLQTVRTDYGDTPAVLRAQELSQTL